VDKSLKGKECGTGIGQREDGRFYARFVNKHGKRQGKYFFVLAEARNWLEDARYADRHDNMFAPADIILDTWFEYWIDNIVGDLAPNTRRNYRERYIHNIQPVIGSMLLAEIKPMHCKMVLNKMGDKYAGSTIRQVYIAMGAMLKSALMNDLIAKHPMNGVRYTKPIRAVEDNKYLTIEEQQRFLETAKRSHNATKPVSNVSLCTPSDTHTPQEQLRAACSPKCCKSCLDTQVLKRLWIDMFM